MSILKKVLTEDTRKFTWVSSGNNMSNSYLAIFDHDETLVSSSTMVDSGNGHYYAFYTTPNTPAMYVGQMGGNIGGNPYKRKIRFKVVPGEV